MSKTIGDFLFVLLLAVSLFSFLQIDKRTYKQKENIPDVIRLNEIANGSVKPVLQTPQILSRHFPDEYKPISVVVSVKDEVKEVSLVNRGPQLNHNWKYISTIVQAGRSIYYFKNTSSKRLLELELNQPVETWELLKAEAGYCLLQEGETVYKVNKK